MIGSCSSELRHHKFSEGHMGRIGKEGCPRSKLAPNLSVSRGPNGHKSMTWGVHIHKGVHKNIEQIGHKELWLLDLARYLVSRHIYNAGPNMDPYNLN